jgi:hypothetical protein
MGDFRVCGFCGERPKMIKVERYAWALCAELAPYRWTKSADDFLASIEHFCLRNALIAQSWAGELLI